MLVSAATEAPPLVGERCFSGCSATNATCRQPGAAGRRGAGRRNRWRYIPGSGTPVRAGREKDPGRCRPWPSYAGARLRVDAYGSAGRPGRRGPLGGWTANVRLLIEEELRRLAEQPGTSLCRPGASRGSSRSRGRWSPRGSPAAHDLAVAVGHVIPVHDEQVSGEAPRHRRRPPRNARSPCPGGVRATAPAFNTRVRVSLLCRNYVAIRGSLSLRPSLQPQRPMDLLIPWAVRWDPQIALVRCCRRSTSGHHSRRHPSGHENFLMMTGAVPRSAPRCQGR